MNEIYNHYHLPMMVVKNGLGAHDTTGADGRIHDDYRVDYLRQYIEQMELIVEGDGADLIRYTPWDCIDLISTSTGEMARRYGFVYVDKFDDRTGDLFHRRKDSFYWYKKVVKTSGEALQSMGNHFTNRDVGTGVRDV